MTDIEYTCPCKSQMGAKLSTNLDDVTCPYQWCHNPWYLPHLETHISLRLSTDCNYKKNYTVKQQKPVGGGGPSPSSAHTLYHSGVEFAHMSRDKTTDLQVRQSLHIKQKHLSSDLQSMNKFPCFRCAPSSNWSGQQLFLAFPVVRLNVYYVYFKISHSSKYINPFTPKSA